MTITYKWKAGHCLTKEETEIESFNLPHVEFEEIPVWTTSGKEGFIAGSYKWQSLRLTEDSTEALKHMINRANGAIYFELAHSEDGGKTGVHVDEAVLQKDGNMFVRNAMWFDNTGDSDAAAE